MKNTLILFALFSFFILFATPSFAQNSNSETNEKQVYKKVEQMPEYDGGFSALMQFIGNKISESEAKGRGKVVLSFVVDSDGSVDDIHILKSLNEVTNEACIRAIKATEGKWLPGRQDGEAVAVRFVLPINYKK